MFCIFYHNKKQFFFFTQKEMRCQEAFTLHGGYFLESTPYDLEGLNVHEKQSKVSKFQAVKYMYGILLSKHNPVCTSNR